MKAVYIVHWINVVVFSLATNSTTEHDGPVSRTQIKPGPELKSMLNLRISL